MRQRRRPADLGAAVQRTADCPCQKHQSQFVDALHATDQLFFVLAAGSTPRSAWGSHSGEPDEGLQLPVSVYRGKRLVQGFTDLEAARQRSGGGDDVVSIPINQALSMVIRNGLDGMMLSNRNTNDAWAAITTEGIRDFFDLEPEPVVEPSPPNMVRVPEGHSVTVVRLSAEPYGGPTTFGFYLGDFGATGASPSALIKDVAVAQAESPSANFLWIIQAGAALTWSTKPGTIDWVFSELQGLISTARPHSHIAVVEEGSNACKEVVNRLHALGVGVHAPAPDGAAIVAVHLPDGTIRVGMPGPVVF